MRNRLNKPHMEVEGNQTTGKTSIAGWNTGGTDRHTDLRFPEVMLLTAVTGRDGSLTVLRVLSTPAGGPPRLEHPTCRQRKKGQQDTHIIYIMYHIA